MQAQLQNMGEQVTGVFAKINILDDLVNERGQTSQILEMQSNTHTQEIWQLTQLLNEKVEKIASLEKIIQDQVEIRLKNDQVNQRVYGQIGVLAERAGQLEIKNAQLLEK